MARIYVTASRTDEEQNASTTYVSYVTASIAPQSGAVYAIFWGALQYGNNNTDQLNCRLQQTTDPSQSLQLFSYSLASNYRGMSDVSAWTAPNSASASFAIQHSRVSGTITSVLKDGYITILKLDTDETASITSSSTSTTSATPTTLNSVTVGAGDWYVIGSAGIGIGATAQAENDINVRINDGTTSYSVRNNFDFSRNANNIAPSWHTTGLVSPSGTTTYNLQFARPGGTFTLTARYRTILVLKKLNFAYATSSIDETTTSTTSTTFVDKLNVADIVSRTRATHLILGFWRNRTTSTAVQASPVISDFRKDNTSVFSSGLFGNVIGGGAYDPDDEYQSGINLPIKLVNTPQKWKIVWRASSGTISTSITNSSIIVLNLDEFTAPEYTYGYFLI